MSRLPDGWRLAELSELASVERGRFSARPRNDPRYYGGHIPFVQTGDIRGADTWLTRYSQTLNDEGLSVSRLFPSGTILMTIAANIGDVSITAIDVACPDSLVAIQPFGNVDTVWLSYALKTHKPHLEYIASQNAQKNINLQVLKPLRITTPPLAEQRKIAQILSTWDEAIALVEALIAALKRRKQGLMQRLLTGEVRFPGFEGAWQEVRLGEIGRCIRGVSYKPDTDLRPHDQQGTVRLLRANNIYAERIDLDSIQFVTRESVKTAQFLEDGDIAICMASGSKEIVGKAAIFDIDDEFDYTVGAFCAIFRTYNSNDKLYASSLFHSEIYRRQLRSAYAGSSINNLKPSDIEGLVFQVPEDHAERKAITEMLYDANSEIDDWVTLLDGFREQKRGLMQRLLTGEVRVTSP